MSDKKHAILVAGEYIDELDRFAAALQAERFKVIAINKS
jgi:hypothetical protein